MEPREEPDSSEAKTHASLFPAPLPATGAVFLSKDAPWQEGLAPVVSLSQDGFAHCHTPLGAAPMMGVSLSALLGSGEVRIFLKKINQEFKWGSQTRK